MVSALGRPARSDYYVDSQQTLHGPRRGVEGEVETRGAWWNPGALFHLSDGHPVDADAFRNLYRGHSPDGRTELKQNRGRRRRSGVDLVFPADKSVSALWALADPATGRLVEQAHDDAVRVALLEVFARYAGWVVRRTIGAGQGMTAADFMGATFRHGSSRENDPHLHTHCVVFNFARTRDDGAYRALQTSPLKCWLKAAGSVYRHALAWNLGERLGVGCEQYGRGEGYIRIAGMPRGLIRDWSKRRRRMTAAMENAGLRIEGASSPQTVLFARATRAGTSDRHPELESLCPAWMRERDAHVADPARLIASLPGPDRSGRRLGEVLQRLDRLPESLAADQALFSFPSVVEAVFNVTAGHMDRRAAMAWAERVLARDDVVRIDNPGRSPAARADLAHTRFYACRDTAGSGDAVKDAARELAADRRFGVTEAAVEGRIEALVAAGYPLAAADIRGIRHGTSPSRVAVLEFAAAADRSLVLRPIADLYREQWFQVFGAAATLRSAAELHNESGMATMQLDRMLKMHRCGALDRDRAAVMVVADAGILTVRQLGNLLDQAERCSAKILLVAMAGQRPLLAAAPGLDLVAGVVGRTRIGAAGSAAGVEPASAIAARALPGRVQIGAGLEDTLERIADDWDLFRTGNPVGRVAVVARTRVEEKALTHILRARLLGGSGGGPRAVIRAHRRAGTREYGASAPLEVRTGDWLRIGVTLWEKRLFCGSVVAVEDIVPRPSGTEEPRFLIRAATECGRRVEFHHDDVRDSHGGIRLRHGYAFTADELTGRFDRILVLADDRWRAEQFDRVAACCRGDLDIHVNRAPLAAAIRPPDGRAEASVADGEAQTLDRLRRLWSPAGDVAAGAGDREAEKLYPDGHGNAEAWLAANDGGGGSLRRLGREIAFSAYGLRHGETVEAVARGRAGILAEWTGHRERIARDGDSALLSPSVGETARRHKALLDLADTLPQLTSRPMRDLLAACGGPGAADMREFRELYRRMRTDRRIAAARHRLRGAPDGVAAARTQRPEEGRRPEEAVDPVRAYLAEVARCRRFRRFVLDAAVRQGFPADDLLSWARCRDDGDRLIARGREMLSGSAVRAPRTGAEAAEVRAAVAALEEEGHQDPSLHGRPPVAAARRPRAGDPGGGPDGERPAAAGEHERHRRTAGRSIGF